MKHQIIIAEPCTEPWEAMAQTGKSDCSFCHSCQKEVIDFTQKSDKEISRIMNSQKDVCGKFTQSQLDKTYQTSESFNIPYKWAMASVFSGLLLTQPALSQSKKTKVHEKLVISDSTSSKSKSKIQAKIVGNDSTITRTVSGIMRDGAGQVLPGATITIKGTENGTVSDLDGKYLIEGIENSTILMYSFAGTSPKEILVRNQVTIDVVLENNTILGGACFRPKTLSPRWFVYKVKRFPRWITSPFRKKSD
jgi:hypothetical protein